MKVRPANATMGAFVTQLGGTNVQASAPEAREVLERGVADAITFPWQSIILFGIDKVTKYHMDMPFWTATFVWTMNKAKYDAMSPAQRAVIDSHCTTEWAEKVASPWADWEHGGHDKVAAMAGHEVYKLTPDQVAAWRQGGGAAEGEMGGAGEGRRCGVRRVASRAEAARRSRGMSGDAPVVRNRMDRFIDGIELLAACFVGIVAVDIFVSVLLRYFFAVSIPDSYDFGKLLLGILIFWGIAATSYRGTHITVDLVWAAAGPRGKRLIDIFATLVLLFVVSVQTAMLFDKVRLTREDNVLTFDLRLPTWPFALVAWLGDVSAVLLIAVRTYRLMFHPDRGRRRRRGQDGGMIELSSDAVAVIGFVVLFALMLLRVPVGMAMGLVGVTGFGYLVGGAPALKMVGQTSMRTVTDYTFGVIPMFLLMGAFVSRSGMSRELFQAANRFVGHLRGGLGIATIAACAGFAAISGSSVATAATFSTVAYPEMRSHHYPQSFATGVIAAGGTLGAMFPPSIVLAVYGLITQQDIGKLFMAGILPGLLAVSMYMATIAVIGAVRPHYLPTAPRSSWRERGKGMRDVWAPLLLFVFVIGGLYGGLFTPTEAGGVGAAGAFLISVARGRLSRADILESLLQATRTAAAVFTILIGAILFGYFLTVTQTPQKVTEFVTGLGFGRYGVLVLIMLMYLVLGCLMDAMAMIILTIPIIFPVITTLGFDPVWFGVIIVMTVELGLIHPPVGMNVFVIKTVVKDVDFSTIFYGVIPFVLTDILRLAILIAFPMLALYLPSHM